KGHVVLVGYGRVGRGVGESLINSGERFAVIESEDDLVELPREEEALVISGNAASADVLETAQIADARILFVAIPESFEAGQIIEQARRLNPAIRIVARAHSQDEVTHLLKMGADMTIMGEQEIARRMIEQARAGA
ncbi:NAD-binding protein, partial [Sphingomonas sp. LaA6.9]|uniref:NAD-binding protein n=1 Tax=Sphingomonas sp. LaA6.9 TaxID=2919914 RepID=UPI001F4F5A3E